MKKEIHLTRRRMALRRVLRLLVMLLLAEYIFGVGLLLPRQAIRQVEQRSGMTGTRVVTRLWCPELYRTHLLYLTENQYGTILADTHWTILGWEGGFGWALDHTDGKTFSVGERAMSRSGKEKNLWCYYGRVDDPEIAEVVISVRAETYLDGKPIYEEVERLRAPAEDWYEKEGRRYFLLVQPGERWPYPEERRVAVAIGLNAEGKTLVQMDIDQGTYSSFG